MRPLHISFLLSMVACQAATVTTTTLAAWQAAGSQSGIVDFESAPSGNVASFVLSGVTFAHTDTPASTPWLTVANFAAFSSGRSLRGTAGSDGVGLRIVLPADTYRVGFFLVNYSVSNPTLSGPVTLRVNNVIETSSLATLPVSPGPVSFYSISDSIPITSITITSNNFYVPFIDNFVWGGNEPPPAETPEAATAILIGSALLLLPTLRRRFSSPSSPQQLAH
jgi:hypothetical protein